MAIFQPIFPIPLPGEDAGVAEFVTTPIAGNGFQSNPLRLEAGTASGNTLVWNGTAWVIQTPAADGLTASTNGLTDDGTTVKLGGTLTEDTNIGTSAGFYLDIDLDNGAGKEAELILDPDFKVQIALSDSSTGLNQGLYAQANGYVLYRDDITADGHHKRFEFDDDPFSVWRIYHADGREAGQWLDDNYLWSLGLAVVSQAKIASGARGRDYLLAAEKTTKLFDTDGTTILSSETLTPTQKTIDASILSANYTGAGGGTADELAGRDSITGEIVPIAIGAGLTLAANELTSSGGLTHPQVLARTLGA